MYEIVPEPFGPTYPVIATVAKYRKIPRDKITEQQKREYSEKLVDAILGMQRSVLQRELPSISPSCASRTWHNNGDGKVGKAIRQQQRGSLQAAVAKIRRDRTDEEWRKMYEAAMKDKKRYPWEIDLTIA